MSNPRTNALNGHVIAFHDADGLPPLPLEVDDEHISSDRVSSTSSARISFMIGFNTIARIFQLIYHCTWRHRSFVSGHFSSEPTSLLAWIEDTRRRLKEILASLPSSLKPGAHNTDQASPALFYGMQAANICITALCLELALVSWPVLYRPAYRDGIHQLIDYRSWTSKRCWSPSTTSTPRDASPLRRYYNNWRSKLSNSGRLRMGKMSGS